MTALIYVIDAAEQIFLAMDTLCRATTGTREYKPHNFCTKLCPLPHIRAIICGTGSRELVYRWSYFVQSSIVGRDLLVLNDVAPVTLAQIDTSLGEAQDGATTSIYHFGQRLDRDEFCGFRFRSANGFVPEELPSEALAYKPDEGVSLDDIPISPLKLPDAFITIMQRQKAASAPVLGDGLVSVGGEVQFAHLTRSGLWLSTVHQFEDLEATYRIMLQGLARG